MTAVIPRQHLVQHPDPEAPRRLHRTEHRDPAGIEEPCGVFIDPGGEEGPASICLDLKVDLSPAQAREVGARLIELADMLTPATAESWLAIQMVLDALNLARDTSHTQESIAEALGIVDLDNASQADVSQIARYIGGVLAT